ncbi:hypothetical protein Poli38472_007392 [Pythium oligandrum]|uniref:FYVE-type domain-containing protein n=1 Tax=Pythium oligandrum TaxID=41045 RepID=A0A8K1CBA2_PYTOL|nr:hypothetical protein Poli38472_007392 [Pythium oligandrum]|eukprot:TMW59247.1 hypothetical protein Poli38472_007392 [Pythium oligandrum]
MTPKPPKFASPFPPLELSAVDRAHLRAVARTFVEDTAEQYERFMREENGYVDPKRWELIRERENLAVYIDAESRDPKSEHYALPMLFTIGTVPGDLDDMVYGILNHTTRSMRLKTSYVQDQFVNCSVLATLLSPTPESPFDSLTVKWIVKGQSVPVQVIFRNREVVYLEATGMTTLSNGEQVGYQLLHSIDLNQTKPRSGVVRGNISICGVCRQKTPQSVEIYLRGFVDPKGKILRPLVIKSCADALLSAWHYMHFARMKKLMWFLRRRRTTAIEAKESEEDLDASCASCQYHFSPFGGRSKRVCQICRMTVCSACRVTKKLSAIGEDGRLLRQRIPFCRSCYDTAIHADAHEIAVDETEWRRSGSATGFKASHRSSLANFTHRLERFTEAASLTEEE